MQVIFDVDRGVEARNELLVVDFAMAAIDF